MLLGALFLLANIYLFNFLAHRRQSLEAEIPKLRADKMSNEAWLAPKEKDLWEKRQDWLDKNQPKLEGTIEGTNAKLLDTLEQLAKDNNLTVTDPKLNPPRKTADYQESSVGLTLVGSLEALCRWLVAVQQPTQFCAITYFSLKADSDANKVKCVITVAKWYQNN